MRNLATITPDPVFPWSIPTYGTPALLLVVLILGGLTVWTYLGVTRASFRRLFIMLCLRFGALLLAILALLRPSYGSRDDLRTPSVLIILADASESMAIKDEYGGLGRWDALRRILERCEPVLQQVRDEQNVTVHIKTFAEVVGDYDPQRTADGKRTDTGSALNQLLQEHGQERYLRGLLVLSDGADNGTRFNAVAEAEKWRRRSCPVHAFSLGQTTTSSKQQDINLVSIIATPSPVPVKNRLNLTVTIDAPGFENALVPVRLFVDDKEVKDALVQERLTRTTGNEVKLSIIAPDKAGEIKVTAKVDPQVGEVNDRNNEISTYVPVGKEGLSVLYVEGRNRVWEPTFIQDALQDPRIRLEYLKLLNEGAHPPGVAEVFKFDKQRYDVIILGDITARRLSGGDNGVLERLRKEVEIRGTGLLMIGGDGNFGAGDWKDNPLGQLLPVDMNESGQVDGSIAIVPTAEGLDRFLMRLADDPKDNAEQWKKLRLDGMTKMGNVRSNIGAVVLARAGDAVTGRPILVSRDFGAGRVLAFAGDTTEQWRKLGLPKTHEGMALHARFWKQIALWLAKQEESSGNVWVKLDARRLSAGDKLGFTVGLRGKGGIDLADAVFTVKVVTPAKTDQVVTASKEATGQRGLVTHTEQTGEYRLVVRARGEDTDGAEITGEASARFLVYQDTAELTRQAADHEFLARLASAGGGKSLAAEELPRFLSELRNQPLPQRGQKVERWPDWQKTPPSNASLRDQLLALHASGAIYIFPLFVTLIGCEWFLRRRWGLV